MLTVHHLQDSQSERIPWLCEELGIPYELKIYHRSPVFSPPDLKNLTPLGASPVITDGDLVLYESGAVAEYIIHIYGGGRLALPPRHPAYADYLHWFHFANGSLQPAMALLFRCGAFSQAPGHAMYDRSADAVRKVLGHLENRLGEQGATWLAGDEFTAADVMSVWSLSGMRVFAPVDLSPYPAILAYLKRVSERAGYQRAKAKADPEREPCLSGPPPEVFKGLGKKYKLVL